MFRDRAVIQVTAGSGGNGVIAWRREKFIPKGGPAGGDGGNGGSVFLESSDHIFSLEAYRHLKVVKAHSGEQGAGKCRSGKKGESITLSVPLGTVIRDARSKEILYDLVTPQRILLARGGKGGLGNTHFTSSTQQAPYKCTPGEPGEELHIELELKLIADIGLVGLPNAGKSTLFSALTHIDAKVGAYPFTTLQPQISFIQQGEDRIRIADIPGIIEGASQNKGLGIEFLRHIERTALLIYVVDAAQNPAQDYEILRKELFQYLPSLLDKPHLLFINKTDLNSTPDPLPQHKMPIFMGSALHHEGIERLIHFLHTNMHVYTTPAINTMVALSGQLHT